ncbi:DUF1476 domain-containing protein [Azospirillum sp. SYSU D00513]|uniref:DUF1476 domain-containing protein n=1 Tax=Azospirillum sp. SYSU D00513 TaxID=2812561 RepID=UPI001A96FED0|nr:DUF1476 domain-containing protein [Azospirillum sp. SYSU D00513]
MTLFDEREQAFENQFSHDQDLMFRVRVRRDRLAGLWAAGLLGKRGAEAESYARDLVEADVGTAGPHDVMERLSRDLHERGVGLTERQMAKELSRISAEARRQVMAE